MEKKQNTYSRQGSSRNAVCERKSSDIAINKPRSGRRRENLNFSNSKNDAQRSKPAKIKPFVDKRPRGRGGCSDSQGSQSLDLSTAGSGLAGFDESVEGQINELNSVYNLGSKKQNMNHLLNFHYSPRERENVLGFFNRHGNRQYAKKHKYNKEQFLQANFQFVVKSESKDIILNASSPDVLVDWSLIEQINIQTTEEPQCPICLYPPIAAKLTRCGHAYCWPCILHYLALSDKTWRKCPICYEAIHIADLKSTAIVQHRVFKIGDSITFQLMRRKKGSFLIEEVNDDNGGDNDLPHLSAEVNQKKFSKFLLADSSEVLSIIKREEHELAFVESEDCPESVFSQQAMELLRDRKSTIINEMKIPSGDDFNETLENVKIGQEKSLVEINFDLNNDEKMDESITQNTRALSVDSGGVIPKNVGKNYYFYQSADGQNIFLHPLNVKMLQMMYGTLDQGPSLIQARIVQTETNSMTEDLRKKFTCLGHMPLTCQYEIVEVHLEPPVISEQVSEAFKDNIRQREKARMKRECEEKRREKEINAIYDRQMGKLVSRTANIDIKSSQQFPVCGSDDGSMIGSFDDLFPSELGDGQLPPPEPKSTVIASSRKPKATTFANILSTTKQEFWPSVSNVKSNEFVENCWGKSSRAALENALNNKADESNGIEDRFSGSSLNFGDAIAVALEQKTSSGVEKEATSRTNSKKSKKNKKTVLFSTGMNFSGN